MWVKKYVRVERACHEAPLIWYNSYLGEQFKYLREDNDAYFVRDPEGYINFIHKCDAKVLKEYIKE